MNYEDFQQATKKIFDMPPPEPMRFVLGYAMAKEAIIAGFADRVIVSPKTLARLRADPDLDNS